MNTLKGSKLDFPSTLFGRNNLGVELDCNDSERILDSEGEEQIREGEGEGEGKVGGKERREGEGQGEEERERKKDEDRSKTGQERVEREINIKERRGGDRERSEEKGRKGFERSRESEGDENAIKDIVEDRLRRIEGKGTNIEISEEFKSKSFSEFFLSPTRPTEEYVRNKYFKC